MLVGDADPVFPAAFAAFTRVEKLCHDRLVVEGLVVLFHGLDFDETQAAIANRVVVVVAMSLLNDNFILQLGQVGRNTEDSVLGASSNTRGGADPQAWSGAGSDKRALAFDSLGEVGGGGIPDFENGHRSA